MSDPRPPATRCGIDTVEVARIDRLLRETPPEDLLKIFSPQELSDSGEGTGRASSLAARFAAKEACLKLFPRETALGAITAADFSVARDGYGAPRLVASDRASDVFNRHRIGEISLSLSHDRGSAAAVALAVPMRLEIPLSGWLLYHLLPFRRAVVLDNMRRVFGDVLSGAEIKQLAQAHYAHIWRLIVEFMRFPLMSQAHRTRLVRVENDQIARTAHALGKGVLLLTGHFGNF